jgi:hypothetical protein
MGIGVGMDGHKPFQISRPVGHIITLLLVILSLFLLLLSNSDWFGGKTILGGSVPSLLSNLGFALLIASAFNWLLEHRFKEQFYRDIHNEIISSQSIRDSGIVRIWEDSKVVDYRDLIKSSKIVRIGVTYSDRFIKDYFTSFDAVGSDFKLYVYLSDTDDEKCRNAIAYNTKQNPEAIKGFGEALQNYIAALINKGVDVTVVSQSTLPHYAFISFDDSHHFIIMSTFASRRAEVPVIECTGSGVFPDLLFSDIKEIESCHPQISSPKPTLPGLLKDLGLTLLGRI